jgi:hypothetical protein
VNAGDWFLIVMALVIVGFVLWALVREIETEKEEE